MRSKIPDRWEKYLPLGSVIKGTRLFACKVPLKRALSDRLPAELQFTPTMLMSSVPQMKYIVDLTGTSRYYNAAEFTANGVQYRKIEVPGRRIPRRFHVNKFYQVIDEFTSNLKDDEIIAIHCTHGLNRTGYLICRYLVEKLEWSLSNAIEEFQKARGHKIERVAYIKDLEEMVERNMHTDQDCSDYYPNGDRHIRFISPIKTNLDNTKIKEENLTLNESISDYTYKMTVADIQSGESSVLPNENQQHIRFNSPPRQSPKNTTNNRRIKKSRTTIIINWHNQSPPPDVTPRISQKIEVSPHDQNSETEKNESQVNKRQRRKRRLKSQVRE